MALYILALGTACSNMMVLRTNLAGGIPPNDDTTFVVVKVKQLTFKDKLLNFE
jgi:hypothetical protein